MLTNEQIEALIKKYEPLIYSLSSTFQIKNTALLELDDLKSECFFALVKLGRKVEDEETFQKMAKEVLKNCLIDKYRNYKVRKQLSHYLVELDDLTGKEAVFKSSDENFEDRLENLKLVLIQKELFKELHVLEELILPSQRTIANAIKDYIRIKHREGKAKFEITQSHIADALNINKSDVQSASNFIKSLIHEEAERWI